MDEGWCIRKYLRFRGTLDKDKAACNLNHIMLQSKVHSALRYFSCRSSGGVLNLDAEVPERPADGGTVMKKCSYVESFFIMILKVNHLIPQP